MVLLERIINSSNKEELCQIKNVKQNQEYSVIFYKNGTYKITQNNREIVLNKIHYQRILKKIFEL